MPVISNPKLRRLYDYWSTKRGDRRLPSRADLDPVEMAFIIGNVILIDVLEGTPPQFRIRLHGTNLAERVGYELTGKMLDDMPAPGFRELSRRTFAKAVRTREPVHSLNERVMDDQVHRYEVLVLPLSADGERIDMLLTGLIYEDFRR